MSAITTKNRGGGKRKASVLTIKIFKRRGSRYWQALIRHGKLKKRITTRSIMESSAREFAELAYRHFAREARKGALK